MNLENDIWLNLRLSFAKFFIEKGLYFEYKENYFNYTLLASKSYPILIGNTFYILEEQSTFLFVSVFSFSRELNLTKDKLLFVCNCINKFATDFIVTLEESEKDFHLVVKRNFKLFPNLEIDDDFWSKQIQSNLDIIQSISIFISQDFLKSKFNLELITLENNEEFELFVQSGLNYIVEKINEVRDKNNDSHKAYISYEEKVQQMSKEEINFEIDKELSNFQKTNDSFKLDILTKYLN